jgi:hypothetical protein
LQVKLEQARLQHEATVAENAAKLQQATKTQQQVAHLYLYLLFDWSDVFI